MTVSAGLDPCGLTPQHWADLALRLKADVARRMRSQNDVADSLLDWGRNCLPQHFRRQPSGMHRWLSEQLDTMTLERGAKLNVIGPRGAAKSTVATLAHVLRVAVEGWEPYVWILSDTRQQACRHLENIKLELLQNEQLAAAYPGAVGQGLVWRGNSIQLRNGVSIEAFGSGQGLRGRRDPGTSPHADRLRRFGERRPPSFGHAPRAIA